MWVIGGILGQNVLRIEYYNYNKGHVFLLSQNKLWVSSPDLTRLSLVVFVLDLVWCSPVEEKNKTKLRNHPFFSVSQMWTESTCWPGPGLTAVNVEVLNQTWSVSTWRRMKWNLHFFGFMSKLMAWRSWKWLLNIDDIRRPYAPTNAAGSWWRLNISLIVIKHNSWIRR